MGKLVHAAMLSLSALFFAATAGATTITLQATGIVTSVASGVSATFSPGQAVSMSWSFDPGVPDDSADPDVGGYNAITSITLSIGGETLSAVQGRILVSANDFNTQTGFTDAYRAQDIAGTLTGDPVQGLQPGRVHILLEGPGGSIFASDALPTSLPDISSFTYTREIAIQYGNNASGFVFAEVTTVVPEPSTALLLGAGLLCLASRRRLLGSSR